MLIRVRKGRGAGGAKRRFGRGDPGAVVGGAVVLLVIFLLLRASSC